MKRTFILMALLALFLLPLANPSLSSIPAARGDEPQKADFLTAADGAESSESITSFSETLPDDVMLYPDSEANDTTWGKATAGKDDGSVAAGFNTNGAYTNTYAYEAGDTSRYEREFFYVAGDTTKSVSLYMNYSAGMDQDSWIFDCLKIEYKFEKIESGGVTFSSGGIKAYDFDGSSWDTVLALGACVQTYTNDTIDIENNKYVDTDGTVAFRFWLTCTNINAGEGIQISIDFCEVLFTFGTGYAESFADVSDWSSSDSFASDGDVITWTFPLSAYHNVWTNDISLAVENLYVEVRYKANVSGVNGRLYGYTGADKTGDIHLLGNSKYYPTTSWSTEKRIITVSATIECIMIYFRCASNTELEFDYLRIGPADEMGWQHDGSTTAGVTDGGGGSSSSDGAELTLTADSDGSSFEITIDTTATSAYLDADYYPMIGLDFNDADSADYVKVESYDGSAWATVIANTTIGTDTLYANCRAADADIKKFRISVNPSANPRLKWFKAFSIANFSVTQAAGCTTSDVVYIDSNEIVFDRDTTNYITLHNDPTLSVATATYNVWNLTMNTRPTTDNFYCNVGGSWESHSSGDTRGTWSGTGTFSDFQYINYGDCVLSAIKFIEDSTAPSVLRISATPPEPDDTESVTLSALATDTVEVYKVWFRPITGPTGYSQTDYEATEQADNLWTYEFSSLDEGYWAFKAIAHDGANNSTLDADSVIDFWVREKELIISNTLYTETSAQCTFAGQTNIACDYLIYDDDVEQESGNKAAGSFFLDWTKQTSVGTHNWGIKFYTASDTDWHNGSYEVLTTTLLVTEYGIRTTTSYAYLNGYVNLNANYTVYEETVQVGTGSVSAGSFEIRWTKASSSVENVTVLFESGAQSYPVYSGYDVAAQVTFVVESWWMDLNLGVESYVEFYVLSSFENATVYVYDNNTLMTTVTESAGGAYSYFWLSESEGLHTITLNITHGATVHTRTRTYYIPDWAATGLVVRWDLWTFQNNYTMLELGSNWMNCTYYVYLNGSLVATSANDPVILNFTRAINIGEYNLTIYADAGAQTYTIKNIRYIITEEGVSYDYSQVTGGRSVRYGDNYNYYTEPHETPPGILIDQGTAAIVSVGGFLIMFVAYLAARHLHIREILKTERIFGK